MDEQHVLDTILRFFAIGDNLVVENLLSRFGREVRHPTATTFYSFQIANEEEHKLTYARLINTMIESEQKRASILRNDDEPALRSMAEWIKRWILDPREPFSVRLLAFVFVEGVFFTSCFAYIYWLRSRNLCPGLGKSNEFISRDENLHALFACLLYGERVRYRVPRERLVQLTLEAMAVSDEFVDAMFGGGDGDAGRIELLGMNGRVMKTYVRHVCNHYLHELHEEIVFPNAYNPFPFMVQQSLEGKTNFFESDVSEYKKAVDVLAANYSENADF
ncbi:ribonucleoside-diphosphate reductase small chain-like [Hylaeus anthracinus]|uniref:ribonucleoside-diphosphate reductase small chain-like n=1 Tax=Hylaeus anthracinus TaxID=313031 RepID=UPI0023BA1F06|nr:ribonucleoside-diphosphate reductase small chain-like [Hylaeus anthracinus]